MFTELTPSQREPLFTLVRFEAAQRQSIVFVVQGRWDATAHRWGPDEAQPILATVPHEVIELWRASGYIVVSQRELGWGTITHALPTLLLTKAAIDYEEWWHKRPLVRALLTLWDKLIDDIPSLIWGVLGGVGAAVLTVWIEKVFHLI